MSKNYEDKVTEEIIYGTNIPDAYDVKVKVEEKQKSNFNSMVSHELSKITREIQKHYVELGRDYTLDVELSAAVSDDKKVIEEISRLLSNKNWVVDGVFDSTDTTKRIWIRPKRIGDSFRMKPISKENKKKRRSSTTELIITVMLAALVITLWR